MSSSALAALLGKKPPAAPTAATPAAAPAAVAAPAPTAAPAPVAAPSSPTPAAAPVAPPPAPALGSSPSLGPNAVTTATPAGSPPDTLAALLGDFTAASGRAPRVNPPQAASVLAGPTAKEVAGHPEPPEVAEEKVAPVAKPAEVIAAENAPKSRRTAAVVQLELDAALARIGELESALVAAGEKAAGLVTTAQDVGEDLTAEAVALIEQLRAEAAVQLEDNRKAWARVAQLEEQPAAAGPTLDGFAKTINDANNFCEAVFAIEQFLPVGSELKIVGKR